MVDSIYQAVQARLNKEQLGYLKPHYYNPFLKNAVRKMYNKLLLDLKSNVRKMNWMLDGKDFAHLSEHIRQLVEYYSTETPSPLVPPFILPDDLEYVEDVFFGDIRVDKIHHSDHLDLRRNIYAKPTECNPVCSKVGDRLKISPDTIGEIDLHYLRQPKTAKWTFNEFQGKPMFNPDAPDFQDVDMPPFAEDELVSLVTEQASKYLRELQLAQLENAEQTQDFQTENRQ